jgi:hypothetical protein
LELVQRYSVVDAVLLTPPLFADPAALVTLGEAPIDTGARSHSIDWNNSEGSQARGQRPSPSESLCLILSPVTREPRHHIHSGSLRFLPYLRDQGICDALGPQGLERGQLGTFPFATHGRSLPQLIAEGHVHPARRPVCRDDSTNHGRLG